MNRWYSNATGALIVPDDRGLIYDANGRPLSARDLLNEIEQGRKTVAEVEEMLDATKEPADVPVPAGQRPTGGVVATPDGSGGLTFSRPSEPIPAELTGAALLSAVVDSITAEAAERTRERLLSAIVRAGHMDEATAQTRYASLSAANKQALFDALTPVRPATL